MQILRGQLKVKQYLKNKKGFTFAEIMIVLVVMGFLLSIAVPTYEQARIKSAEKADEATMLVVENAVELYNSIEDNKISITTPSDGAEKFKELVTQLHTKDYLSDDTLTPAQKGKVFVYDETSNNVTTQ